ncbi:hypothetical protein [Bacillus sp. REN3]|uniref:hypothetical protein n=1 Tax=Bacillus sp. REN3 TaxID=2802440 RepID=UPI001AEEF21B|nr:hypothetical protein [Bacillus sp. REN3]
MKRILLLAAVAAAMMAAGCVQDNAESLYNKNEDNAGRDLTLSNDGKHDGGDFINHGDDDMTLSDQNPNLLNTDNENHHSYSQDVQKAKDVISSKGYRPGKIWINGGIMYVTAHPNGRLKGKQRNRAEKSLEKSLTRALPRYDIHVDIE